VRVLCYRYHFAPRGDAAWWRRTLEGEWLPPLEVNDPRLADYVAVSGWRH
jgi:hypothetical protein